MGCMPDLAKVGTQYHSIAKVSWGSHGTTTPLTPCEPGRVTTPNSHSSEQDTLPTTSLIISKSFHTGHVATPVVLGGLLLRLSP
jgi:hypothetical protein